MKQSDLKPCPFDGHQIAVNPLACPPSDNSPQPEIIPPGCDTCADFHTNCFGSITDETCTSYRPA